MRHSFPDRPSKYGTSVSLQCCSWHTATSLLFAKSCTADVDIIHMALSIFFGTQELCACPRSHLMLSNSKQC